MVPIQLWATPIWGRARSWSLNPTAFIMARAGARSGPSRRTRLLLRGSTGMATTPFSLLAKRRGGRILQQVAEAGQRVAVPTQGRDEGRQHVDRPRSGTWDAVR